MFSRIYPEWTFDRKGTVFKHISANSNLNFHPNPNPRAQIPFWENEMTSFANMLMYSIKMTHIFTLRDH